MSSHSRRRGPGWRQLSWSGLPVRGSVLPDRPSQPSDSESQAGLLSEVASQSRSLLDPSCRRRPDRWQVELAGSPLQVFGRPDALPGPPLRPGPDVTGCMHPGPERHGRRSLGSRPGPAANPAIAWRDARYEPVRLPAIRRRGFGALFRGSVSRLGALRPTVRTQVPPRPAAALA